MRNVKNIFVLIVIIAAVTTAAIWWILQANPDGQNFSASIIDAIAGPPNITAIKAGVVSHHLLAENIIINFYEKVGNKDVSTVYLLSPDHFNNYFEPDVVAYVSSRDWDTPYGKLSADTNIINKLSDLPEIETKDQVLMLDHGITVEIPFIKRFFPNAKVVPLILKNNSDFENFYALGEKLKEFSGENTILIVSSDFSHDAPSLQAKTSDRKSIAVLKNLSSGNFIQNTSDCKQCFASLSGFLKNYDTGFYLLDNKNSFNISGESENSVTSYVTGYYAKKNYTEILFVGDIMFDRGIRYFANKNNGNNFIFDKIYPELLNKDLVVANLEGPITNSNSVSIETEPEEADNFLFTFDPSVAQTLFDNNIKIVNLGNNHILNFGEEGLKSTQNYLDQANVSYFGDPSGNISATKTIHNVKIAFVGYNEFLGDNQKQVVDEINKLKTEVDIVVISCHWGAEYMPSPTETQKDLAHLFIDSGADLLIGSHPHVTQPMEEYKGKRIYYSLGNFIFDQYFSEETTEGLGVTLKINSQTKELSFQEIKFNLQPNGQTIITN